MVRRIDLGGEWPSVCADRDRVAAMIVRAIDDGATNASIVHGCWAPGLLPILLPVLDIAAVQDVVPSREMLDDNLYRDDGNDHSSHSNSKKRRDYRRIVDARIHGPALFGERAPFFASVVIDGCFPFFTLIQSGHLPAR